MTKRSRIKNGPTLYTQICSSTNMHTQYFLLNEFLKHLEDNYLNISKIHFVSAPYTVYGVRKFKESMEALKKTNIRTIFSFPANDAKNKLTAETIKYCKDKDWKVEFY